MFSAMLMLITVATAMVAQQVAAQRQSTCPQVTECLRAFKAARDAQRDNYIDFEQEIVGAVSQLSKTKGVAFNGQPKCNEAKLRDYVTKWQRIQQLKEDNYGRMEQCITRSNSWGRGFEPCALPTEANMPQSCISPMTLLQNLLGAAGNAAPPPNAPAGRSGSIWALLADPATELSDPSAPQSDEPQSDAPVDEAALSDPTVEEAPAGRRLKRATIPERGQDGPFKAIEACLKDRCGCPEVDMCEKCYYNHKNAKEIMTLDMQLLTIRWDCGIQLKTLL